MSDFNIRADAVDVEQIMRQIRARIRDKRGVDYTEEQIQELARVRLEKFLDPKGVRSDLLEQFRRRAETDLPPNYEFDDTTLFASRRPIVAFFRRLLRPVLKLFLNPAITALRMQSPINRHLLDHDALFYEIVHNLVVEMTRTSIDVKTIQMRVESYRDGSTSTSAAPGRSRRSCSIGPMPCPSAVTAGRRRVRAPRKGLHHPASIQSPEGRACGRVAAGGGGDGAAGRASRRTTGKDEGRATSDARAATSDERRTTSEDGERRANDERRATGSERRRSSE